MANQWLVGVRLEPGESVRTFDLTAAQFNDLTGTVVAPETDGRVLVDLVLADGSTARKKLRPKNLLLIYDCATCVVLLWARASWMGCA